MLILALGASSATASSQAADLFAGIPRALQPFVDRHEISGAVMLVATKDRVLHPSAAQASSPPRTTWLASTR